MKTNTTLLRPLLVLGLASALSVGASASAPPDVTEDGLVRVKDAKVDLVYRLPAAKFDGYKKVMLVEPQISFKKNWQDDRNDSSSSISKLPNRISDSDVQKMIETGKKLLAEEFAGALTKAGYALSTERAADVLVVRPSIVNLDITAPDPNQMAGAWSKTYSDGAGEATLYVELYDAVTAQLLVRAIDHRTGNDNGFSWRINRTQATNINDARMAFAEWAQMLVKGLERAKTTKAP